MSVSTFPATWDFKQFGQLASFKNGINFTSLQKGRGVLTIDVKNMYSDNDQVQLDKLYRVEIALSNDFLLQPNDILFVRSSLKQEGIGWPALFPGYQEPVTFCGFIIRARLISEDLVPGFLIHYLRLPSVRNVVVSKSGKVAITNINQASLQSLSIPVPPLPEQRAIASTLRAVQDARDSRRRELALERERKAALMEDLFTYGTRGEPCKQTEIGPMPESWRVKPLGHITASLSGGTPSKQNPEWWSGTIPWASPKDMKQPRLHDTQDHITKDAAETSSNIVPVKSLFIVVRGMVLAKDVPVAITEVPMAFNQDMKALIPNHLADSDFLLYALINRKKDMGRIIGTSAHGTRRIGSSDLDALKIPLPSLDEQHDIAEVLTACDQKIAALEAETALHNELFRALLEELMTGRISTLAIAGDDGKG